MNGVALADEFSAAAVPEALDAAAAEAWLVDDGAIVVVVGDVEPVELEEDDVGIADRATEVVERLPIAALLLAELLALLESADNVPLVLAEVEVEVEVDESVTEVVGYH